VEHTPDALLVTMLAMVCPFDPPEKQALLEAAEGPQRAEMLVALLRMGAAANVPNPGSLS
jgi:Lon protease-like protein